VDRRILSFARLACAQTVQPNSATLAQQLGSGFQSKLADVNGTRLHYVRGGSGPAVVLLHGFPEDWYEFRLVMPRLAKRFTVIAVDLRGVGESAPSDSRYDAANLAEDIHQLAGTRHIPPTRHGAMAMASISILYSGDANCTI